MGGPNLEVFKVRRQDLYSASRFEAQSDYTNDSTCIRLKPSLTLSHTH